MRKYVFYGSVIALIILPFPLSIIPVALAAVTIDILKEK